MRFFLILGSFLFILSIKGQSVLDFKKKSSTNSVSRTAMLDLLRTSVKKEINQDVVFVVNHFLVSGNYAWLEATAQSKISGKELRMPEDGYDCCGVQALFIKNAKGVWKILDSGAFSTDVWYHCIGKRYPNANPRIFTEIAYNSYCE